MFSLKKQNTASSDEAVEKTKWPTTEVLLVVLVLAINGAWIQWSYNNLIVASNTQSVIAASNIQLQKGQELLDFHLRKIGGALNQFSQRKAVIDTLVNAEGDLTPWLPRLQQSLPTGSQVAILRTFEAPETQYPDVEFRFAELDMINHAKRNEQPLAEINGQKSNIRTMTMVQAVATDSTEEGTSPAVIGVLFARIPVSYLEQALQQKLEPTGQFQLVQSFAKTKPQTVLSVGNGNGPAVDHRLNDLWSMRYRAGPDLIKSVKSIPYMVYLSWLAVLLISALGAVWLVRHQRKAVALKTAKAKNRDKNAIMSVELAEEDRDLLSGEASSRSANHQPTDHTSDTKTSSRFSRTPFRAYDIRGLAHQEIDEDFALHLGKALGSKIHQAGGQQIFVGRDGRTSSPELCQALIRGLTGSGIEVLDLGLIPSPLLHYAVATSDDCKNGVIVTASHNSAEYNGFKISLNGQSLTEQEIAQLHTDMERAQFQVGQANAHPAPITEQYIDEILSDIALMGEVRMVIDAGNAATSDIAPTLFSEMGCDVIPLYCEVDGTFPNHDPDPSKEINLQDLIAKVKQEQADLGVAFDGDGDRIFVVTESGEIITPDRLLMLFARDIVARNPGTDIVYDVKCTRQLGTLISSYGGRPIMWKTGHANMKSKILETGALLGGEYSGHIFFKDRWYGFDDGMLAAARLLEIMSLREQGLDEIFSAFPVLPATPEIRIPVPESKKFAIIQSLIDQGDFQSGTASTIDGLRVDFAKGWGLARASNTGPELTLRFEGETEEVIDQLKMLFKRELEKIDSEINLDF